MKKKVVFILSSPHSGSTILDLAVGAHSRCLSLGEIVALDEELEKDTHCVCRDRISDCKFWTKVFENVRAGRQIPKDDMSPFYLNPLSSRAKAQGGKVRRLFELMGMSRCNEEWATNTKAIFDAALDVSGKDILVDSSKDPIRALRLATVLRDYDCYFLHLVRDVRGVANSCMKKTYKVILPGDSESRVFPRQDCIPPVDAARQWSRFNARALILSAFRVAPRRRFRVRYEELCNEPEKTLQSVGQWLGLSYESDMRFFGRAEHHNVRGNPSRFNSKEIRSTDDTWREGLSDAELEQCMREGTFLRHLLGYEDGVGESSISRRGGNV